MSDPQTPPTGPTAPPAGAPPAGVPPIDPAESAAKGLTEEVSLEDLDKLLDEEDPEFAKALAELRLIETDSSVEIESSVSTDDDPSTPMATPSATPTANLSAVPVVESLQGVAKYKHLMKTRLSEISRDLKAQAAQTAKDTWESARTWPKRSLSFLKATSKTTYEKVLIPIHIVKGFSRAQKIALVSCVAIVVICLTLFWANLRGIWLPYLNEPILGSFAEVASKGFAYNEKSDVALFYEAFPKEPHEFLLAKIKINLTRTEEHANPMGAFEIIISVDSKDTAIELGSREVEFNDLAQRSLEEETFENLVTEIGKMRFKSKLKREISNKLTQGWVKEISFKTFVLKP